MSILVTGFDPFGDDKINPAFEAVKLLPDNISGENIIKLEVPTVFEKGAATLKEAMIKHQPSAVICVGQAGGRSAVSLEQVAINLNEARIPDNEGNQPLGVPIIEEGPTAYFTNLPIKAMMQRIQANGLPAYLSYTAGTFVCNELMYQLMYLIETQFPNILGGFIHVPFIPEQVIQRPPGTPSMSVTDIARSLELAITAIIEGDEVQKETANGTLH